MIRYANLGGNSGVWGYEVGDSFIKVRFNDGCTYLYDGMRPGRSQVEEMKRLANAGIGLNSYISRYIKKNYARKG